MHLPAWPKHTDTLKPWKLSPVHTPSVLMSFCAHHFPKTNIDSNFNGTARIAPIAAERFCVSNNRTHLVTGLGYHYGTWSLISAASTFLKIKAFLGLWHVWTSWKELGGLYVYLVQNIGMWCELSCELYKARYEKLVCFVLALRNVLTLNLNSDNAQLRLEILNL